MEIANNTTIITKKQIKRMQQAELFKGSWLVALIAAILILSAFRIRNGQFVFESITFAVLGGISYPLYIMIVEILMAKHNKLIPEVMTYIFIFTNSEILAFANNGKDSEKVALPYNKIPRYSIGKKFINIYISKNATLMIDKAGFENEGDCKKIENLLKLKVTPSKVPKQ